MFELIGVEALPFSWIHETSVTHSTQRQILDHGLDKISARCWSSSSVTKLFFMDAIDMPLRQTRIKDAKEAVGSVSLPGIDVESRTSMKTGRASLRQPGARLMVASARSCSVATVLF